MNQVHLADAAFLVPPQASGKSRKCGEFPKPGEMCIGICLRELVGKVLVGWSSLRMGNKAFDSKGHELRDHVPVYVSKDEYARVTELLK